VAGADAYRLELGTSLGAHDILDSGELSGTSFDASALAPAPSDVIYGRVWTRYGGNWRFSSTVFSLGSTPATAHMNWMTTPDIFDARDAFRWSTVPLAASYRLRIGTSAGAGDLHDSGSIRTPRRLVDGLPANVRLYGSLDTEFLDGSTATEEFEFTVLQADIDFDSRWTHAMWATAEVRGMAEINNIPQPNSILIDAGRIYSRESAVSCTDYAQALLELLADLNSGLDSRPLGVCLNEFECHKLVEVFHPALNKWVLLDPTFGLVAKRASDGAWASAMDMFEALSAQDFSAIEYLTLTPSGTMFADRYYLDYPLLFGRVYETDSWSAALGKVETAEPFFEVVPSPAVSQWGYYAVRCLGNRSTVSIRVTGSGLQADQNGVATLACQSGNDGFSPVFIAATIDSADDPGAYEIARPRRFVFD
jgi:hypothetical protein